MGKLFINSVTGTKVLHIMFKNNYCLLFKQNGLYRVENVPNVPEQI